MNPTYLAIATAIKEANASFASDMPKVVLITRGIVGGVVAKIALALTMIDPEFDGEAFAKHCGF